MFGTFMSDGGVEGIRLLLGKLGMKSLLRGSWLLNGFDFPSHWASI